MSECPRRNPKLKPAGFGGGVLPVPEEMRAFAAWVSARDHKVTTSKAADDRLDAAAARAMARLLQLVKKFIARGDAVGSQIAAAGWYGLREHKAVRAWWASLPFSTRLALIREGWAADRGGSIAEAVPPAVWRKFDAQVQRAGLLDFVAEQADNGG